MKSSAKKTLVTVAASLALVAPQIASAQQCVERADLADGVTYLMPMMYQAFQKQCAGQLSADGFLNTQGSAFIAPYEAAREESWSGAYRLFGEFAKRGRSSGRSSQISESFGEMPSEVLRPVFDAMIQIELAKIFKPEICGDVERVIEPLAPLPPENLGMFVANLVGMMPKIRNPEICPVSAP